MHAMSPGEYPGAVAPARQYKIDVGGLGLAVHEWGQEAAQPLFLVHGGFAFPRGFTFRRGNLLRGFHRLSRWSFLYYFRFAFGLVRGSVEDGFGLMAFRNGLRLFFSELVRVGHGFLVSE